ncbi:hypothetical protein [Microvirga calopogonii]|uniref:hypothetical protein n=1 Tax=Microvirga calopogonii TaxID=2078013 RepID=UPI003CCAA1D8
MLPMKPLHCHGLALAAFIILSMLVPEPANAVVYCKTVGVPKGCVARPVAPVARRAAVTPGVGAAGVGIRPGTPMNRGGPVNRVGRR